MILIPQKTKIDHIFMEWFHYVNIYHRRSVPSSIFGCPKLIFFLVNSLDIFGFKVQKQVEKRNVRK